MSDDSILIVDDNPDDVEITRAVIAELGRLEKVEAASRGELALKILRLGECQPSLILLDLKMPGMSGIDTLREIRADDKLQRMPMTTAARDVMKAAMLQGLGADNLTGVVRLFATP